VQNQSTDEMIVTNKNKLAQTQKVSNYELGENSEDLAYPM